MSQPTQRQPRELLSRISDHCLFFAYTPGLKGIQYKAALAAHDDAMTLWWSFTKIDLKAQAASGQ